jgi:hypothetical protein
MGLVNGTTSKGVTPQNSTGVTPQNPVIKSNSITTTNIPTKTDSASFTNTPLGESSFFQDVTPGKGTGTANDVNPGTVTNQLSVAISNQEQTGGVLANDTRAGAAGNGMQFDVEAVSNDGSGKTTGYQVKFTDKQNPGDYAIYNVNADNTLSPVNEPFWHPPNSIWDKTDAITTDYNANVLSQSNNPPQNSIDDLGAGKLSPVVLPTSTSTDKTTGNTLNRTTIMTFPNIIPHQAGAAKAGQYNLLAYTQLNTDNKTISTAATVVAVKSATTGKYTLFKVSPSGMQYSNTDITSDQYSALLSGKATVNSLAPAFTPIGSNANWASATVQSIYDDYVQGYPQLNSKAN